MELPVELQPGERVILLRRRHWLHVYPRLLRDALAGVVPIALLVWTVERTAGFDGGARTATLLVSLLWGGYWAAHGYFTWYRYQHDIWLITSERLIDALRRHWFHRQVASADLVDIEDVAVVREGVIRTLFDFGDVRCQTAGEQPNFVLAGIPGPAHVLTVLDAARDDARRALARGS